jgi:ATP-dependent DNA ligase
LPAVPLFVSSPPSGPLWSQEIKFDGYRLIARKHGDQVRLSTRPGSDSARLHPDQRGGASFSRSQLIMAALRNSPVDKKKITSVTAVSVRERR